MTSLCGSSLDQVADPIHASTSRKVKIICEAMSRSGDTRWTEAYVRARRAKLEVAIKHFVDTRTKSDTPHHQRSNSLDVRSVSPPLTPRRSGHGFVGVLPTEGNERPRCCYS